MVERIICSTGTQYLAPTTPAYIAADLLLQAAQIQRHPDKGLSSAGPQAQRPAVELIQHADGFSRAHGVAAHVHGKTGVILYLAALTSTI